LDHYGIRKDMVAFPFCHVTLSAAKPGDRAYPVELKRIGDHLKKRRLELGLLQRDVAERIGVTKCTIQYWENNRVAPAVRFIPRISEFLGYDPGADAHSSSLAEQLKNQRRKLGLSQKKLASLLGIDQSSVAGWETEKHKPTKKSLKHIRIFLLSSDSLNGGND